MGEGKSSVIIPLVAATLANGSNLARIVTLKPLSNQMFQLLVSRLSDLADRRIFCVPFSRDLRMSTGMLETISTLYRQCAVQGGVLVVQPEHIFSQKLTSIDTLLAARDQPGKRDIAKGLSELQSWLARVSRDVLDESDEILHVRYQLIYTTPKIVLTLLKTSAENYFIASNTTANGIVLKKNEDWFFEYYKDGKLISEKLLVKF